MSILSPKNILHSYAKGEYDKKVIVSPLLSEKCVRKVYGLPMDITQDSPEMIEAKLNFAKECCFPPVLKFELNSFGIKVSEAIKNVDLNTADYLEKVIWYYENCFSKECFCSKLFALTSLIGERGALCVNIGQPFHTIIPGVEKQIFAVYDEPDLMRRACEARTVFIEEIIDISVEGGVMLFFASQLSRNMFSPENIRDWMLPYSKKLAERCREHGAIYYLHECGSMQRELEANIYHELSPGWLEGFESPPNGDISDFAGARRKLPKKMVLKGNLSPLFLQTAPAGEVRKAVLAVLEQTRGYRHIVGGSCSLLEDTPPENIREMSNAVREFHG